MTLELKIDENEFEGENSHNETTEKKCFACSYIFRTIPAYCKLLQQI